MMRKLGLGAIALILAVVPFGVVRDQFAEGELVEDTRVEKRDADSMSTVGEGTVVDFAAQQDAVCATGRAHVDHHRTQWVCHFVDEEQTRSVRRDVDDVTTKPKR